MQDNKTVSSFSPNADMFAFQANGCQKKFINLYPLDASIHYQINKSLVNRVNHELPELDTSEIKFLSWCLASNEQHQFKVKRSRDEIKVENSKKEWYPINVFSNGRIVVFSPNGQRVMNIIHNKRDVVGMCTVGSSIWILDDSKTAKHFTSNSARASKEFKLTEATDGDIIGFEALIFSNVVYLAVITENRVYIIDPTNRFPSTVAELEMYGCKLSKVLDDGHIVLADAKKVFIVNFKNQQIVQSWDIEAQKIDVFNQTIAVLDIYGIISIFKQDEKDALSNIKVGNKTIIDFNYSETGSIIVVCLNVNEPSFELVTSQDLLAKSKIVLEWSTDNSLPTPNIESTDLLSEKKQVFNDGIQLPKPLSKSEQYLLKQQLIQAITGEPEHENLVSILSSKKWSENEIKFFISRELSQESCNILFEIITHHLTINPCSSSPQIKSWLKWLLVLRSSHIDALTSHNNKLKKNIKGSLKLCSDKLPVLLSIQGALEMLKEQSSLRQEFSKLNIKKIPTEDSLVQEENEIVYLNGEGDDFSDASS